MRPRLIRTTTVAAICILSMFMVTQVTAAQDRVTCRV